MSDSPDPRGKRPEFLLEMYKQMMADINRHIVVIWQSVGVVVGSFAIFGLTEKKVLSLDIATGLVVLICSWALGLLLDSSYWYNRTLCIIANIERLFLFEPDLRHVHYYFGKHRPKNRMISTIRLQAALCFGIASLVLAFHFIDRVAPGFGLPLCDFKPSRAFPYATVIVVGILLILFRRKRNRDYTEFLKNSPGISVATDGIEYGGGHGFREGEG